MKSFCVLALLCLTACSGLKPVADRSRFFVLSEARCQPSESEMLNIAVGIGKVELPEYLKKSAIAVRSGANELKFSDRYFWAERLETAIQRTLPRDMALTNAYFTAWKHDAVALEIHIVIERFDLDEHGKATLRAQYRIIPAGSRTQRSGVAEFSRVGPGIEKDPSAAVESLSQVLGDLGCELRRRCVEIAAAGRGLAEPAKGE